jgi:hypothetical protein
MLRLAAQICEPTLRRERSGSCAIALAAVPAEDRRGETFGLIQAQVIDLFMDLQERLGLTYLFIAHDSPWSGTSRIAVMYLGRIVEIADRDDLYRTPLHPYTEALMAAVPVADPVHTRCFHTRCPRAIAVCKTAQPLLQRPDRAVACHLHANWIFFPLVRGEETQFSLRLGIGASNCVISAVFGALPLKVSTLPSTEITT